MAGNVKNLVHFKPGQSGNPKGRPKTKTARETLRAVLNEPSKVPGKTNLRVWAEELIAETDCKIRIEILRWLEGGSPKESVEPDESDDQARIPTPDDILNAIRAMGFVQKIMGQTESSTLCDTGEQGEVGSSETPQTSE